MGLSFGIPEKKLFTVVTGGSETTDDLVKRLEFPVDSDIRQEYFPIHPSKTQNQVLISLLDAKERMWDGLVYGWIHGEGPQRILSAYTSNRVGFVGDLMIHHVKAKHPTVEQSIRFAHQYGATVASQEDERPIVFLTDGGLVNHRKFYLLLVRSPLKLTLIWDCAEFTKDRLYAVAYSDFTELVLSRIQTV
jgi:hypothetical protein